MANVADEPDGLSSFVSEILIKNTVTRVGGSDEITFPYIIHASRLRTMQYFTWI